MKIKYVTFVTLGAILASVFTFSFIAHAEEGNNPIGEIQNRARERVEMIREEYRAQQETLRAQLEVRREEFKTNLETKREEARTKIEAEREALKARMELIRDTRKSEAVLRIADRLNELNTKMLRHFTDALEKLEKIVERIQARTDELSGRGTDVSEVTLALTNATEKIRIARVAIDAQALKTYPIATSTESGLRDAVKAARDLLNKDLRTVSVVVKEARDGVHAAAVAFGKVHGSDDDSDDDSATSTTTSTTP